jgi:phosphinothricin acetyltransferase
LPSSLELRLAIAAASDIPAIAEIYCHHVLHGLASFEEQPPDDEEMARRHGETLSRGLPYLVARTGDTVVGYAYAAPYRMRSAYRFSLEDSVYIAPGHIGRGTGRLLLARLLAACTALGYRQMVAVIGDSAHLASIRLHEQLGFSHAGTLRAVGFKLGRWVDSVLMQRPLGDGDATSPAASEGRP